MTLTIFDKTMNFLTELVRKRKSNDREVAESIKQME